MDPKAREAKNAYMREWRAKNKERLKIHQENYWRKKSQEGRREINK